jgi:hypothetical protein
MPGDRDDALPWGNDMMKWTAFFGTEIPQDLLSSFLVPFTYIKLLDLCVLVYLYLISYFMYTAIIICFYPTIQ